MNESNDNKKFNYSYSADDIPEIEKIRSKYIEKEETSLDTLRRLDKRATLPGTMVSVSMGIIGTLLFGAGMSCVMVWSDNLFILGIIVGIIGIAFAAAAYPVYSRITKACRKKIAPKIMELSDKLIKK